MTTLDKADLIKGLGVSIKETQEEMAKVRKRVGNGGICVCGHAKTSHTESVAPGKSPHHDAARASGKNICMPTSFICPCTKFNQVLLTADSRKFRHSTTGPGPGHALSKGIVTVLAADIDTRWTNNAVCGAWCGRSRFDVDLTPVAYTVAWYESNEPTDYNILVCRDCRDKIEADFAGVVEHRRPV